MELSTIRGATSSVATRWIFSTKWSPKVHYRSHKSFPHVPTLSQINPVHTILFYVYMINVNVVRFEAFTEATMKNAVF
jgi:hypothetical protein